MDHRPPRPRSEKRSTASTLVVKVVAGQHGVVTPADFGRHYGVDPKALRRYLRRRWQGEHEHDADWDLDIRMVDDALSHFGHPGSKLSAMRSSHLTAEPPSVVDRAASARPASPDMAVRASRPQGLHHQLLKEARAAGIPLSPGGKVHWLSTRGHLADSLQGVVPAELLGALAAMHQQLGGDDQLLAGKKGGNHPVPDLIHDELGCVIEVDEVQHFTTARARTFDLYPGTIRLGYSLDEYVGLVHRWKASGDRNFAHQTAADFPEQGGRQSQRAYNDALRDLLAPTFTGYPVIRIAAPDRSMRTALVQLQGALEHLG